MLHAWLAQGRGGRYGKKKRERERSGRGRGRESVRKKEEEIRVRLDAAPEIKVNKNIHNKLQLLDA